MSIAIENNPKVSPGETDLPFMIESSNKVIWNMRQ